MNTLESSERLHLEAAIGWCEQHAYEEAIEELEWIPSGLRAHPKVLEVRWQVCANLGRWEEALRTAAALSSLVPDQPNGWIDQACSLRQLHRHREAYDLLREAARRLPRDENILYDLACVCCALKRPREALAWLDWAMNLGGYEIKTRALDDPDFEPLQAEILGEP
jgi:tetratricopeptide (TPR) repeat protein